MLPSYCIILIPVNKYERVCVCVCVKSEEARREKYGNALRRFLAIQDQVQMLEKGLPELNMRAKEKYLTFLDASERQLNRIIQDLTSRVYASSC